ncbi:GTA baseplate fiber-binding domain-containing protein, partial [Methylobacterium sp. Leaf118]|uniref:GTA baseplate fiber-binding domain-containing protein n=1 Tax=Methylobacterium sp. Leaf118 TaxID=2876562 RepID=UPI003FA539E8
VAGRDPLAAGSPPPVRTPPALPGPVFARVLDLPAVGSDPVALSVLAVAAEPWPGAVAVWRSTGEGAPFAFHRLVDHPACLGETLSVLPAGPVWRFDRVAQLDLRLRHAEGLSAVGESAALAGANLFALVGPDGATEILSAAGVALIGPGTWRLTTLLRGLAGSEAAAGRPTPAGSLIMRLDDGAVTPLVERLDEAGRTFLYRVGPAGRDPADPAFVGFAATAGLSAFTPLSPVHLRARREPGGVRLSWTRRARRDADAWEPADVPLEDGAEAYAVDILDPDGAVRRSLTAVGPSLLYAQEAADFGGPRTAIDFAVAQVGTVGGRGPARRARVTLTT